MSTPRYLVDTSVLLRSTIDAVGNRINELALEGKLWTCRVVDLEYVYSCRAGEVGEVIAEREALPEAPITPDVTSRALRVAGLMAKAGRHRGAKPADLIIAAAAEARGLTVLHYDADFDRIAAVTGQPTEWVSPKGTLEH